MRAETIALALVVAVPIFFNAIALWPELTPIANVNDDAVHELLVIRANAAIDRGENPVDFWAPDLELGFPQFVYYQHLPHLAVVAIDRILLERVDIVLVFNLVRYVLLVAFPLTVLWSMRTMSFSPVAAAIGAACSSVLSSNGLLGFDYDSYVWRGSGVFTQLFAMHLSFIVLAALYRLLVTGRGYAIAVVGLAALILSHLLYAYMMAISSILLVLAGVRRSIPVRTVRLAIVGVTSGVIASYMVVPAALSGQFLEVSPYLQRYKYDSFGAPTVLDHLFSGRLLDAGHLPVFTVLLGVGIVAAAVTRFRPALLAVGLFVVWLVLYFGRPTLGPLADLLPFHQILFFHRFIGGVHLAAILLIGFGGAWLWELGAPWRHPARLVPATAALALLLVPAMQQRWDYYALNASWIAQTSAAIDRDVNAQTILSTLASLPPGRVYAGLRTDWADELDFGIPFRSVRMYNLLAFRRIAALTQPYQGLSLNADLLFDFDATREVDYRVFGVTYVIAPATHQLPNFLEPIRRTPLYVLYAAPASAAARFAAVTDTVRAPTQVELFSIMRSWLHGPAPDTHVLRIEYPAEPGGSTGASQPGCADGGTIESDRVEPSRVEAVVRCASAATLVLNMTYHPNWRVTVDGAATETFMVSPSMVGINVPAGRHTVIADYRSTPMKAPLLIVGGIVLAVVVVGGRRLDRVDARLTAR